MLRRPDSYVTFINGCVIQARIHSYARDVHFGVRV